MTVTAPKSSSISAAFFNTRIGFATATIILSVVVGGLAVLIQFNQMKNQAWYELALHQIRDTTNIINVQAYQVVFSPTQEQRVTATQELQTSLILFVNQFRKIAESDPDGEELQRNEDMRARSPWLFAEVHNANSRLLDRIQQDSELEFPTPLEDIWEDDMDLAATSEQRHPAVGDGGSTETPTNQIESLNFELMALASQLTLLAEAEPSNADLAIADRIWHLTSERLLPSFEIAINILVEERLNSFSLLELIFLTVASVVLIVKGLNVFFVYQPMRRQLVDTQIDLENQAKNAQNADRAKSVFLANMSHEIRTPINGILGMAQLLERSSLDAKQRNFLGMLSSSGKTLLTVINDVLDFSKIEAGEIQLNPVETDLIQIVDETVTVLSVRRPNSNTVELVTKVQPGLPKTVDVDAERLRQVITNLVSNALKFTDYGHVLVELAGEVNQDTLNATIRVSDTGRGIPQNALSRLFERFIQVDADHGKAREGTGLGLSICKHLVELMGGTISVESQLGSGSTFCVQLSLPISNAETNDWRLPDEARGANCLVIDDNVVSLDVIANYLKSWDLSVSAQSHTDDCLRVLRNWRNNAADCHLLIMSTRVLELGGQEVISEVEKLGATGCQIIITKNPDLGGQSHLWQDMQIIEVLHRPICMKSLYDAVKNGLGAVTGPASENASKDNPSVSTGVIPTPISDKENSSSQLTLLVDDNEVNRVVAGEILTLLGQKYITATNGLEALESFKSNKPDLILMDVAMPVMDGLEATSAIRDLETMHTRPTIVGMTAYAMAEDKQRCLEHGMDDYVAKPISFGGMETLYEQWPARDRT